MTLFIVGFIIGYLISEGFKVESEANTAREVESLQSKLEHEITQKNYLQDANNMLVKRIKGA